MGHKLSLSKLLISAFLLVMVLTACSSAPTPTEIPPTSKLINTPIPTNTPLPTDTPLPTATLAPPPDPIVLSGSGDSIVDVQKWNGFAIANIKYNGGRNFIVKSYDSNGEQIDLLVNKVGNYEGTVPLDISDGQQTTRFEIKSSGQWEIQVLPIEQVKRFNIPGTLKGNGDDVIILLGTSNPDLLKIDASQAERNFILKGIGKSTRLLANAIAPYTGTVMIPGNLLTSSGVLMLEIKATGEWSIEVTTK
jgi:hypothetical protein